MTSESYRLDIHAANMARSAPEFCPTLAEARRRRKALVTFGYRVTIFRSMPDGTLKPVR
jgi:hypothetical protein